MAAKRRKRRKENLRKISFFGLKNHVRNILLFNNLRTKKGVKHANMCDREKISDTNPYCNLILPVPDTDFRDFLDEVEELAGFAAQIIEAIEKDLDAHAREKKKLRLEDRRFFESARRSCRSWTSRRRRISWRQS